MFNAGTEALAGLTSRTAAGDTSVSSGSSRCPRPKRTRGTGAPQRPKGFGKRLEHVRDVIPRLPVAGPAYAYAEPVVHPDLKIYCCPERLSGGSAPLGLSKEGNSQNQSRRGLSGMPHSASRKVRGILTLMEDFRERLAFLTVSLPDETLHAMAGTDQWPLFQRRYTDLVTQHLKDHGDEALVVAVVEIGDFRARRTGRPLPHIHLVCTGWNKKVKGLGYLLTPAIHDQLIAKALQYAGSSRAVGQASGNIQPVKKSVANYVSKYLTKQAATAEVDLGDGYEDLIPHQWWNRSDAAHALITGHLFRLPQAFAAFVVQRQAMLEAQGLGRGGPVQIGVRKTLTGELPVEIFRFQFVTPEALHQALEFYVLWCMEERQHTGSGGGGCPREA